MMLIIRYVNVHLHDHFVASQCFHHHAPNSQKPVNLYSLYMHTKQHGYSIGKRDERECKYYEQTKSDHSNKISSPSMVWTQLIQTAIDTGSTLNIGQISCHSHRIFQCKVRFKMFSNYHFAVAFHRIKRINSGRSGCNSSWIIQNCLG